MENRQGYYGDMPVLDYLKADNQAEFSNVNEFLGYSREIPVLDYWGTSKISTVAPNTAPNKNISRKESIEGFPGVSYNGVTPLQRVSRGHVENASFFKQQGMVEMEGIRICTLCRRGIPKNERELGGLKLYYCLQCTLNTYRNEHKMYHIEGNISKPFYCSVCEVRHSELDFHGEATCQVCQESLECIVQLEEHYLIHQYHY